MPSASQSFKGNKRALPSKVCIACQRPMTWRKAWARNWAQVKYCSDACRQQARKTAAGNTANEVPCTADIAQPARVIR